MSAELAERRAVLLLPSSTVAVQLEWIAGGLRCAWAPPLERRLERRPHGAPEGVAKSQFIVDAVRADPPGPPEAYRRSLALKAQERAPSARQVAQAYAGTKTLPRPRRKERSCASCTPSMAAARWFDAASARWSRAVRCAPALLPRAIDLFRRAAAEGNGAVHHPGLRRGGQPPACRRPGASPSTALGGGADAASTVFRFPRRRSAIWWRSAAAAPESPRTGVDPVDAIASCWLARADACVTRSAKRWIFAGRLAYRLRTDRR